MDIVLNVCVTELESDTPKCVFSWGGGGGVDSTPHSTKEKNMPYEIGLIIPMTSSNSIQIAGI